MQPNLPHEETAKIRELERRMLAHRVDIARLWNQNQRGTYGIPIGGPAPTGSWCDASCLLVTWPGGTHNCGSSIGATSWTLSQQAAALAESCEDCEWTMSPVSYHCYTGWYFLLQHTGEATNVLQLSLYGSASFTSGVELLAQWTAAAPCDDVWYTSWPKTFARVFQYPTKTFPASITVSSTTCPTSSPPTTSPPATTTPRPCGARTCAWKWNGTAWASHKSCLSGCVCPDAPDDDGAYIGQIVYRVCEAP